MSVAFDSASPLNLPAMFLHDSFANPQSQPVAGLRFIGLKSLKEACLDRQRYARPIVGNREAAHGAPIHPRRAQTQVKRTARRKRLSGIADEV